MGLNRYKYLVRTYATLYYLGADRVPGAARHPGSCARAASLSPGSVTAGSWHSVAGYLAVLPIAHVGYLRAATISGCDHHYSGPVWELFHTARLSGVSIVRY